MLYAILVFLLGLGMGLGTGFVLGGWQSRSRLRLYEVFIEERLAIINPPELQASREPRRVPQVRPQRDFPGLFPEHAEALAARKAS